MEIRKLAVAATGRLHLRGPDDELLYDDAERTRPVVVVLHGPGSRQYAQAQAAQSNRMLEKLRRKGKTEQSAEQKAVEAAEFLADCTEAFEHLEYEGLEGRALARAVYLDKEIGFIADQAAKYIGDWANFTKGSTTS